MGVVNNTPPPLLAVWTDSVSGLMWQVEPTGQEMNWSDTIIHCENFSLGSYDDWRLPTVSELRSLIRGCYATELDGPCGVSDPDCLDIDCWNDAGSGCGISNQRDPYWPSKIKGEGLLSFWSSSKTDDERFWDVDFDDANVGCSSLEDVRSVRCVR